MNLKELFESLPVEQRESLINVKTEGELDALLAGAGIAATAETKAAFLGGTANESLRELTADEIGHVTGGRGGRERRRVSSPSAGCVHGFNARCDRVGVMRGGVASHEKCGFLAHDGGEWVCMYGGE